MNLRNHLKNFGLTLALGSALIAAPSAFARSHYSVSVGGPGYGISYSDCSHCRGGNWSGYVGGGWYSPAYYGPTYYSYGPSYYDPYPYGGVVYRGPVYHSYYHRDRYYHDGYYRRDYDRHDRRYDHDRGYDRHHYYGH